jgi:hypothetical protein
VSADDALAAMGRDPEADARTNLAYWYPRIRDVVPTPETYIAQTDIPLIALLDGEPVPGYGDFAAALVTAGDRVGWPCFLRTGHGSDKHSWRETCFVPDADALPLHVTRLVEWSFSVDLMGLPTNTWVVRKMLDTAPLFHCEAFGDFPVTREFRLMVRDGVVVHWQPYWPPDAVEQGRPDTLNWRELLADASERGDDWAALVALAVEAGRAVGGGYWSIDVLQDRHGKWWVTDMADGDSSFVWRP